MKNSEVLFAGIFVVVMLVLVGFCMKEFTKVMTEMFYSVNYTPEPF